MRSAQRFRQFYSAYRQQRDLIAVGAYQKGSDPRTDEAIALYPRLSAFLQQETDEPVNLADAESGLTDTTKIS
jgi:flagellum-specific ATP synthase